MQNTRLNNLFDAIFDRISRLFSNPWRRISLLAIALLFGIFLGSAIPTTAGQNAGLDITGAGILVLFTEVISWFVYRYNRRPTKLGEGVTRISLLADILNALKIGLMYSLFLEAFKLGS